MSEYKDTIRRQIIAKRNMLSPDTVANKSLSIISMLEQTAIYQESKNILAYYPINNEINTIPTLVSIIERGNLFLPKIIEDNRLSIHHVSDMRELKMGKFSLYEPQNEPIDDLSIIDMVIVPVVAFDIALGRIGYGGGYYDRLLHELASIPKIGLAYQMQMVDDAMTKLHDISMDMVIVEDTIYKKK